MKNKYMALKSGIYSEKLEVRYMKCEWKYFIVLNNEDRLHNLVEDKIDDELLICCDVAVAKSFSSPDELLEWVKVNTDLKAEDGDFKIEGQYLPF